MNDNHIGSGSASSLRHQAAAQALLDYAQTGLIALSGANEILFANTTARAVLGLDGLSHQLSAETCIRLDQAEQGRLHLLLERKYEGPLRLKNRAGQTLIVTLRHEEDGTVLVALVPCLEDGCEPVSHDALTGLADRQGFRDRLATLCAASSERGVAVLLIDLDRFKAVNDTLGHPAGDALIKLVAQRLRTIFRGADVISRLGGDEFAVAMASLPEVPALADRLVAMLSRPYLVDRQAAVVGASVGIAFAPQHANDPDGLIRAADLALYQAKAEGRGTVRVFNDDLDLRARTRHALAEDLRRAIPLQQLELHFQPQTSLAKGTLEGFEALVRWNHPRLGKVPPDQFIPLAEDMGLILPLGEWVLREACRIAKTWPGHLSVAVNVSPKQLLDRERLPRVIASTLASLRFPAHRLEIEITENALVREAEALEVLTAIRAMGVRVSMDDFGTGYSSLSQLRRFPFDKLKIDRSFVQDLGHNEEAGAVVRAIAALGRSLGMATIAEGVETAEQEARCRADGCTEIQGYLVSKPVPEKEVAGLIATLTRNP